MKKSDIYEVTIKILGLYLAVSCFSIFGSLILGLSQFIYVSGSDFNGNTKSNFNLGDIVLFLGEAAFILVYLRILRIMIFKTKTIVKKITVDSDYEENAKLFAEKQTVLEIALMIIGGISVVWAIPEIGNKIYLLLSRSYKSNNYVSYFISTLIQLVLGILIFLDAKPLAKYFLRDKKAEDK